MRNDDDVEGHMHAMNHPAEDEAGPEGLAAATDDDEGDDTKGHLLSYSARGRPERT